MPRLCSSDKKPQRSCKDRPRRSTDQAITTSIGDGLRPCAWHQSQGADPCLSGPRCPHPGTRPRSRVRYVPRQSRSRSWLAVVCSSVTDSEIDRCAHSSVPRIRLARADFDADRPINTISVLRGFPYSRHSHPAAHRPQSPSRVVAGAWDARSQNLNLCDRPHIRWAVCRDSLLLSNLGDDHAVDQVGDWNVLGHGLCAWQRPCAIADGAIPGRRSRSSHQSL
jgi:hypothetical protein